jgi:two-component system sensor histidine kinase KdpD
MWLWALDGVSPLRRTAQGPSFCSLLRAEDRAMSLSEIAAAPERPRRTPHWAAYALSLLLVAAATALAVGVEREVAPPNLSLVFILPVVIAAIRFGWGPAMAAAVAGVVACNYFLLAPRYTLHVSDPANVWSLVLLLAAAGAISAVASEARRRTMEAWEALDQSAALQALARALVAARDERAIARACADTLTRLFRAPTVVFVGEGEELRLVARAGGAEVSASDEEAARWVSAAGLPTRGGVYPVDESAYDFWPVQTPQRRRAVIGAQISGRDAGRPETPERLVETVGGYLAVALDREAYARQLLESRLAIASERMKSDLLAAVSHDLKTPLSTILVTLQSLRKFGDAHDPATREALLASAEDEAARLSGMVGNLLDVNRLEAGALPVKTAPARPFDLVAAALERAGFALADRTVVNAVDGEGAPLMVDASLFETALANILENAGKYSEAGSTIQIRAGQDRRSGWIEVLDEGPGFPEVVEPLFDKFARGVSGDGRPPGTGLGLTIARGFMEAQGGRIGAANRADRPGAIVRLVAPLAAERSRASVA